MTRRNAEIKPIEAQAESAPTAAASLTGMLCRSISSNNFKESTYCLFKLYPLMRIP